MSCPALSSWRLEVSNNSVAGRNIAVWMGPGSMSQAILPSQNVITVSSVNSYHRDLPSTTPPASGYFTGGDTVYVRAVVSDPFRQLRYQRKSAGNEAGDHDPGLGQRHRDQRPAP